MLSVEETTHAVEGIVILFLNLLFLLGLDLGTTSWGRWSGDGNLGSSGVGQPVSFLEAEAGGERGAGEVLESVDNQVVHGVLVWHTDGQVDGGDVLGVVVESIKDVVLSDIKNLGWVGLTVIEDVQDLHLVEEWSDLELIQKSGLTWGDLVTLSNNLDWVDNLDLRLDNLGLNVQGLEERGLLWIHTGWTSLDSHISWGKGTDLGWSLSDLGVDDLLDARKITIGEDETSVQSEGISDDGEVWSWLAGLLVLINHLLNSLSHEGVLSHDHNGVLLSECFSHNTDLLGGDVVDVHEHALGVLGAAGLGLLPNSILTLSLH